ncbi:DUF106 domain-containing protein [Halorubraceae archaeon YAN]|nr:DUF106 domain-containing protein [Halorubraceae archaeon YAN]
MSRIESKVRTLARESKEMRSAIETVLERAEGGDVKWVDVRDDITSGQWGRLIEKEILVDGDEGFRIEDLAGVQAGLEAESDYEYEEIETTSWTKWDKGAGLFTLLLFIGYAFSSVRDVIGTSVDLVIGPIDAVLPFYAVIMVLALATGLYSSLLRVGLMDMEKMGEYQARMKDMSSRRKEARKSGDDEEMDRLQEQQMEMMGDQIGMMKEQFRPMVWIMFLTIPAFLWLYWRVWDGQGAELGTLVVPFAGEVTWTTGIIGPIQMWIVWYFLCSMAFTQIIQKGLNISMSPTAS